MRRIRWLSFILTVVLFGLGTGPDRSVLAEVGPGIVWVLALLATMMSTESMFRRDFEDGTLEQMLLHGRPLFAAVHGKLFAHWCTSGLLLTVLSPLAALMLQIACGGRTDAGSQPGARHADADPDRGGRRGR